MPGSNPLTTLDRFFHFCTNIVPIGYNGTPQIHPQNCPLTFDDNHSHLIHPSLDRPHSPCQTASGSIQLFCHSTIVDIPSCLPGIAQIEGKMAVPSYYVSDFSTKGWCEPRARIGKGLSRCRCAVITPNLGYNQSQHIR